MFAHHSELKRFAVGDAVRFEVVIHKGKPQASEVTADTLEPISDEAAGQEVFSTLSLVFDVTGRETSPVLVCALRYLSIAAVFFQPLPCSPKRSSMSTSVGFLVVLLTSAFCLSVSCCVVGGMKRSSKCSEKIAQALFPFAAPKRHAGSAWARNVGTTAGNRICRAPRRT